MIDEGEKKIKIKKKNHKHTQQIGQVEILTYQIPNTYIICGTSY